MQPLGGNMSNIPAFLGKLWKIVNDPNTDHLICWSPAGNSFIIQNQAQFWYELLPLYYKHNNMSSFVRQLNMYGFHKMSTVENGTGDVDKDEIQFFHKYFHRDQPELLRNIKRKATVSKSENNMQNMLKYDDISKVLTDVKHLYGRQNSVDSQLTTMKQENAVLWRELAILRQKHLKQQQIVNKLIQFLVTLVQPATSRMGVGVKRRMPLMLHESPKSTKKPKTTKKSINQTNNINNGPTIHELDNEIELSPEQFFDQDLVESDTEMVTSPQTSVASPSNTQSESRPASVSSNDGKPNTKLPSNFWDKPEFVEITNLASDDLMLSDNETPAEETTNNLSAPDNQNQEKEVFLNPNSRNTLLSNLANGSYNPNVINTKNGKRTTTSSNSKVNSINNLLDLNNKDTNPDMQVATRINNGTVGTNECFRDDLDTHLETTQGEIDQLKDILKGCGGLDANTLLGLFTDETPSYGLSTNHCENSRDGTLDSLTADPMVSGTELATSNNLIDFNELFDDSLDSHDAPLPLEIPPPESDHSSINTPLIVKSEPIFPNLEKDL